MDFSASVNPLGPSPHAVRASRSALVYMVHYPDPGCVALREALAKRYGLPAESFLIGSGSSELIQLVPAALSIRRALVLGPTFSEYARAVRLHGGEVSRLDAERSEQYQPPLRETLSALHAARRSFDAVFVCNPNRPTGQAVSNGELSAVVRSAGRRCRNAGNGSSTGACGPAPCRQGGPRRRGPPRARACRRVRPSRRPGPARRTRRRHRRTG
ncbi:MAG: aminotransferase class I/II-fold pyridoxal phosphate-dependent enzyme [Telluria sp.]